MGLKVTASSPGVVALLSPRPSGTQKQHEGETPDAAADGHHDAAPHTKQKPTAAEKRWGVKEALGVRLVGREGGPKPEMGGENE